MTSLTQNLNYHRNKSIFEIPSKENQISNLEATTKNAKPLTTLNHSSISKTDQN